jgi:hypothetical protein
MLCCSSWPQIFFNEASPHTFPNSLLLSRALPFLPANPGQLSPGSLARGGGAAHPQWLQFPSRLHPLPAY